MRNLPPISPTPSLFPCKSKGKTYCIRNLVLLSLLWLEEKRKREREDIEEVNLPNENVEKEWKLQVLVNSKENLMRTSVDMNNVLCSIQVQEHGCTRVNESSPTSCHTWRMHAR